MNDVIEIQGQFYIRANASIADAMTRVLKYADTFAIFDGHGDIRPLGFENQGAFHEGTRFLSRWKLGLRGAPPLLLSSNVREDNDFLAVDLTNAVFKLDDGRSVASGALHIARTQFLWEADLFERIEISNFGLEPVTVTLELEYQADFVDVFELRGTTRAKRGQMGLSAVTSNTVTLSYEGLDAVLRQTLIHFNPPPDEIDEAHAVFTVHVKPQAKTVIECQARFMTGNLVAAVDDFHHAFARVHAKYEEYRSRITAITTSNQRFNDWLRQSRADLHMLSTATPEGLYPYAGIPWFSCVFGRDGIITALETLWMAPEIARGVLCYLASHQANELNPARDAEPGKILHEQRKGEMAGLGEVPFGLYYGSIDSTPLWLMLAGAYFKRTNDRELVARLWPHVERALEWIDRYGDCDGDGFVEYRQKSPDGLHNQGWKDSGDAVFHANGALAHPPIALCEVQAYVYAAKLQAALLADALGRAPDAKRLRSEAERLQAKFHEAFWCEDLGIYAIALDGEKQPCRVRSSNAGQCLYCGIATPPHASRVKDNLLTNAFFSGWGIRTIAVGEPRYNPMSYHNGSIWPHDNALIAAGFARYGFKDAAEKVLTALFEASQYVDSHRLPELYCGFPRRIGEGPILYPVACNPQAWSSAAVFGALQACLGIGIEASPQRIYFENPRLPHCLREVEFVDLRVGSATVDIVLLRNDDEVAVNVRRRTGKVDVVVIH